jgi:hypothetical protein
MEPRNRFQGMNSASLCSLAGRYDNSIPLRFLAPIDSLKKGLCGRCFSEFIDWRYSQSCWYVRPSFVNCCGVAPLILYLVISPPLPCVNKNTVHTYTECTVWGERDMGIWASTAKQYTCSKVPSQVDFFR